MDIAYYIKTSMVNYEPFLSSVVFTRGCNMDCPYCHNKRLEDEKLIDVETVMTHLKEREGVLEAVVITGGEPTLQKELIDFAKDIKALGYLVKLDTNGTNPKVIETLIEEKLVDYIAMDIKALPEDYESICGCSYSQVEKTLRLLRAFGNYELRTTIYPLLSEKDMDKLCQLYGDDPYILQQYRQMDDNMLPAYEDGVVQTIARRNNVPIRNI